MTKISGLSALLELLLSLAQEETRARKSERETGGKKTPRKTRPKRARLMINFACEDNNNNNKSESAQFMAWQQLPDSGVGRGAGGAEGKLARRRSGGKSVRRDLKRAQVALTHNSQLISDLRLLSDWLTDWLSNWVYSHSLSEYTHTRCAARACVAPLPSHFALESRWYFKCCKRS